MAADALDSTISEFALYLEMELGRGKNTRASYVSDVSLFAKFLRKKGVDDFANARHEHLLAWIEEVSAEDKPATQSRKLSSVKALGGYLIEEKIWDRDLSKLVARPKIRREVPHTLSISEVDALLSKPADNKFESVRDRAMLELMYSSGLRVSELCAVNASDIDFQEGVVRVRGKGEKTRLVPVGESAEEAIMAYQAMVSENVKKIKGAELFITRRGKKLSRKTFWFNIKKYAERMGLRDVAHPHILRHSFATHLLQNGANLLAIREMLGHKDLSTTQIYTKLVNGKLFQEYALHHPRSGMKLNYASRNSAAAPLPKP